MTQELTVTPRPYQSESIAVNAAMLGGGGGVWNAMATGVGKSVCMAGVYAAATGRVLILEERRTLVHQMAAALERFTGDPFDIEMGERRADGWMGGAPCRGVVACVQSISKARRIAKFNPFDFDLVLVDEVHHARAWNTMYATVLSHFRRNAKCLLSGWTGTIRKGLGDYFPTAGYRMPLKVAVREGWLAEPKQKFVALGDIRWAEIKRTAHGEFNPDELAAVMDRTEFNHKGVRAALGLLGDRPAVWFCCSVEHAEHVAETINSYRRGSAVAVHRGTATIPRRTKVGAALRGFRRGDWQHLVGCDLLVEGYDEPRVRAVVIFRPVRQQGRYLQMVGRVTRLAEGFEPTAPDAAGRVAQVRASAKPDGLVVDVMGSSLEHRDRPVCLADVLSTLPPRFRGRPSPSDRGDGSVVLADEEVRRRMEYDRRLRAAVQAEEVKYETTDVDLFEWKPGQCGVPRPKAAVDKPSWFVLRALRAQGISTVGLSKKEAANLYGLSRLLADGRPSEKQLYRLRRNGEEPDEWTPWKASIVLDLLYARGWAPRRFRLTRERWSIIKLAGDNRYQACFRDPDRGPLRLGPVFYDEDSVRRVIGQCLEAPPPKELFPCSTNR